MKQQKRFLKSLPKFERPLLFFPSRRLTSTSFPFGNLLSKYLHERKLNNS